MQANVVQSMWTRLMNKPHLDELTLNVTAFKPRSLELIEGVASGRLRRVVLTKRGRPVAALVPIEGRREELLGALADLMRPVAGIDLTEPTGERWDAEGD